MFYEKLRIVFGPKRSSRDSSVLGSQLQIVIDGFVYTTHAAAQGQQQVEEAGWRVQDDDYDVFCSFLLFISLIHNKFNDKYFCIFHRFFAYL